MLFLRSGSSVWPDVLSFSSLLASSSRHLVAHLVGTTGTSDTNDTNDTNLIANTLGTQVEAILPEGLLLRVTHAREKGERLHPDKGLNFPGTELQLSPLTEQDRRDLDFIAHYADIVGYSFLLLLQYSTNCNDQVLQGWQPRDIQL